MKKSNFKIFKKSILLVILSIALYSCDKPGYYIIKGNIECVDVDFMLLLYNNKQDTIPVDNHTFTFSGTTDTVQMAYLVNPKTNKKLDFIIEQGEISITCNGEGLLAKGTITNDSYSEYKIGMDKTTEKVMSLYQVYLKQETDDDKKSAMQEYNNAEEERLAFMRKQLRKNPNLTGLQILKPIYRTDSISNLSGYLNILKQYKDSEIYKEVEQYNNSVATASPGNLAPPIELVNLEGEKITLDSFKGKYVLLDFWFTGCTYCDRLVPHLKEIYKDLHPKGFEIIDISVDKKEEDWRMTAAKKDSPWIHLHDPLKEVASTYGMPGYPILILIDREGKVLKRLVGYRNEAELRKEIMSVMTF